MIKHNSLLGQQLFRKQAILRATVMQDTHNEKAGGKLTKRLSALFFYLPFLPKTARSRLPHRIHTSDRLNTIRRANFHLAGMLT